MRRAVASSLLLGILLAVASPLRASPDDGLPLPAASHGIVTGFDPKEDGLPFPNVGSYASPNGDCFGFSLVAVQRFQARKSGASLPRGAADDLPEKALAGVIQNRYLTAWGQGLSRGINQTLAPTTDPTVGNKIIESLTAGNPVMVHLDSGDLGSHVVVFFGYVDGSFQIYDPNFPGDTETWGFDAKKGFSSWSWKYGSVKKVAAYDPKDIAAAPKLADLEALRTSCDALGATCAAPYMTVGTSLEPTIDPGRGVALLVTGTVSGGLATDPEGRTAEAPDSVVFYLNGKVVDSAPLDSSGAFSKSLAVGLFTQDTNDLRVVAQTSHGRLAGWADVSAPRPVPTVLPAPASVGIVRAVTTARGH
jgi:hypothetical protein